MFGLLHAMYVALMTAGSGIKASYLNSKGKSRGMERRMNGENPANTYYDRKGFERDIDTDELRMRKVVNGDKVMTDLNGNIVCNFSKEQREKSMEKEMEEGKRFVIYMHHADVRNHADLPQLKNDGNYLKDIVTGRIVVECDAVIKWEKERELASGVTVWDPKVPAFAKVYLDVYSRQILGETDWTKQFRHDNYAEIMTDDMMEKCISFMNFHRILGEKANSMYHYDNPQLMIREYSNGCRTATVSWLDEEFDF